MLAIARRAAERTVPADIARLERHLAEKAEALGRSDRPRAIQLSGLFHLGIAEIARQRVMERFLLELVSRASLVIGAVRPQRRFRLRHGRAPADPAGPGPP